MVPIKMLSTLYIKSTYICHCQRRLTESYLNVECQGNLFENKKYCKNSIARGGKMDPYNALIKR